eukprot:Clim_evm19s241 gene=Clim_evmTU19s241
MAMRIPNSGVRSMMKEGSNYLSGLDEAVIRNIEACAEMVNLVRTSLGPNGMNKMVINHLEKLFVTNDAATILMELEVEHPAAKLLVMASQMQKAEMGDGTNFTMIFAGELLSMAKELIIMGVPPADIITGFDVAEAKCQELMEKLVVDTLAQGDLESVEKVTKALMTTVGSRQYGFHDFLTPVIAEACISVLPKKVTSFDVDNIRIVKILGQSVHGTQWVSGMLFNREPEGTVTHVDDAKIAVFTCGIDSAKTETKGTVLIKNAAELTEFSKGEEKQMEQMIKEVSDAGVKIVVCGSAVGELALHYLNHHGIMVVKILSKFDLRRLCRATGATPLSRFGKPMAEEIGTVHRAEVMEIGNNRCVVFRQKKESHVSQVATIVVRGSTLNLMDDVERAIDAAVNTYKQLARDGRMLAGAGASEIELGRLLQEYGETRPGLDQYAVKKFGEAFEVVPRILAENSGANATEVISNLYAAHSGGRVNDGFDVEAEQAGTLVDAKEKGIMDLLVMKSHGLRLAHQAASTVLRVDQIIMAKKAGGPKVKQNTNWDED